jgi:ubiquinone/menaquinone biosynthesis C-methylase UbiE
VTSFQYDHSDIHLNYDESRKLPVETIKLWLETIGRHLPKDSIKIIVDLGCGTGRFGKPLSDYFSAQVIGIDPSTKMIGTARESISSAAVEFVQGAAEEIPLADGHADLLFLSMVLHHIQNKEKAVREFARVLKPNGFLCIRTSTKEALNSYIWLRFFPRARQIELERIPSRDSILEILQIHEFKLCAHDILQQYYAKDLKEYFDKLSLRGISSLQMIPDDEFKQGLRNFEQYCLENDKGEPIFEEIDLFLFRLG